MTQEMTNFQKIAKDGRLKQVVNLVSMPVHDVTGMSVREETWAGTLQ